MANHPNRPIVRDQNGNALHRKPFQVKNKATGAIGWGRQVWFGSSPATNVRWYVYASEQAAIDGAISDDFNNCPDLVAMSMGGFTLVSGAPIRSAKMNKPLDLDAVNGVTVRELIAFLKTANPNSLVVMGDHKVVRRVELDVVGAGDTSRPIARLKGR